MIISNYLLLTVDWVFLRSERLEPAKMREELSRQTFGQEGAVGEIVTAIRHFSQPDNVISPNTFLNVTTGPTLTVSGVFRVHLATIYPSPSSRWTFLTCR